MDQTHYKTLIIKSLKGDANQQEISELNHWLKQSEDHRSIEMEIKKAWNQSELYYANIDLDEDTAWNKIEPKLETEKSGLPVKWLAIAASILLVVGALFLFQSQELGDPNTNQISEYSNDSEKSKLIELADGSTVRLAQDSYLTYESAETRKVVLNGEAYFEVQHNANLPFEVHTENTTVSVLGTTFNINGKNKNEIQVSLIEGSVAFEAGNQKLILNPGEYASFIRSTNSLRNQGRFNSQDTYLRDQKLEFDSTPLQSVVETLEHYFNTDIILKGNYKECTFTGIFSEPKLEQILEVLAFTFDMESSKQDETKVIFIKNCNT